MGDKLSKKEVKAYVDSKLFQLTNEVLENDDSEVIKENHAKNKNFMDFLKQFQEDLDSDKLEYKVVEAPQEYVATHRYKKNKEDDNLDTYSKLNLGR